jgi:RNA polymerase sigma-70 factor (ECF subfamily)
MPLEDLLDTDHQARLVWDFCRGLDLSALYDSVRSRVGATRGLAADRSAGGASLAGFFSIAGGAGAVQCPGLATDRSGRGPTMSEDPSSFAGFLRRIRSGDQGAAAELVRLYEPAIRLEVRRRLNDPSLFPLFESMDVCQSVLASFFVRVAVGQYDLGGPGQLLGLLVAMARNKLASHVRRQHRQRCDSRRRAANADERLRECLDPASPDRIAEGKELLERVRQALTDEERQLAELRAEGLTWPEVAACVGGQAQARRRQLGRALSCVARQLGLEEVSDG